MAPHPFGRAHPSGGRRRCGSSTYSSGASNVERVPAQRGTVLGQGGAGIMVDRAVLRLGVDKTRVTDAAGQESAARALAGLVGLDAETYAARVAGAEERAFVEAIVVREEDPAGIDVEAARAIPGVNVVPDSLPRAPTRRLARPVLGTVGEATADVDGASDDTVRPGDVVGLSGLQDLMRAVVTEGSGDFLADVPGVPVGSRAAPRSSGRRTRPATTRG